MISRKRRAELLGKALEILIEQPEGLPANAVLERISQTNGLNDEEVQARRKRSLRRFEELIWLATIAPTKAGWLLNDPERWMLTEEGKQAYQSCSNAATFSHRAASRSLKGWMSV